MKHIKIKDCVLMPDFKMCWVEESCGEWLLFFEWDSKLVKCIHCENEEEANNLRDSFL